MSLFRLLIPPLAPFAASLIPEYSQPRNKSIAVVTGRSDAARKTYLADMQSPVITGPQTLTTWEKVSAPGKKEEDFEESR